MLWTLGSVYITACEHTSKESAGKNHQGHSQAWNDVSSPSSSGPPDSCDSSSRVPEPQVLNKSRGIIGLEGEWHQLLTTIVPTKHQQLQGQTQHESHSEGKITAFTTGLSRSETFCSTRDRAQGLTHSSAAL